MRTHIGMYVKTGSSWEWRNWRVAQLWSAGAGRYSGPQSGNGTGVLRMTSGEAQLPEKCGRAEMSDRSQEPSKRAENVAGILEWCNLNPG
jgi:hypothetical protein